MQFEIDGVSTQSVTPTEQGEFESTFTIEERTEALEATFEQLQAKLAAEPGTTQADSVTQQSATPDAS